MSGTPDAEAEGVVPKVHVKREIKTIVENLETILGDLKDVAKELKEVNVQGKTNTVQLCGALCYFHKLALWMLSKHHCLRGDGGANVHLTEACKGL